MLEKDLFHRHLDIVIKRHEFCLTVRCDVRERCFDPVEIVHADRHLFPAAADCPVKRLLQTHQGFDHRIIHMDISDDSRPKIRADICKLWIHAEGDARRLHFILRQTGFDPEISAESTRRTFSAVQIRTVREELDISLLLLLAFHLGSHHGEARTDPFDIGTRQAGQICIVEFYDRHLQHLLTGLARIQSISLLYS